jgi:hypothetical protein
VYDVTSENNRGEWSITGKSRDTHQFFSLDQSSPTHKSSHQIWE